VGVVAVTGGVAASPPGAWRASGPSWAGLETCARVLVLALGARVR